jgi:signal transduction histidine kinase
MRTVLFVDDEPEVLSSLKRLLRTETYDLLFAQSAREALDLLERERVHVIVVDLRMPEMDGFELLKRVEQKYPDLIRMVLSGRDDRDSILNAINSGNVYRYIVKPSDNMELRLIVRQAIDVFNLQQEKRDLLKKLEEHNRLLETRVQERTSQLLAIRSQAEIGKYASQIVHNMNNSLLVMQGRLHLADLELSEASPDLNELEKDVQSIKSSVDDMEKIVAGILIHARDNTRCRTEEIEINEIIKRELDFFEADPVYKYQVSKHINLSDNLPPIRGDAIQIKQIADNLIKNAIDAMENSPEKKLIVETFSDDNTVAIRISDTGEGISEENLARIFSPDFTTKPIGKGTGLGLASVRTMVDAYSGEIQVESKKGVGTTFTVRLPAGKLVE